MNRDQAVAFINSINAIVGYVPPIHMVGISQGDVMRMIIAVAGGQATCSMKFDLKDAAPATKPASDPSPPAPIADVQQGS